MSWVNNRKTTIEKDQAYCLLGNFEVHMPLIYGEGWKNAFRRLREVAKFYFQARALLYPLQTLTSSIGPRS